MPSSWLLQGSCVEYPNEKSQQLMIQGAVDARQFCSGKVVFLSAELQEE